MVIYEYSYKVKIRVLIVLPLILLVSLLVDQWVLNIVNTYLQNGIFLFQKIEFVADSLTNNASLYFLILSIVGLLTSSFYLKDLKWISFFLTWLIVFLAAALITSYFKMSFGRIRPDEILTNRLPGVHYWFKGRDSFPSGHISFYFSLFFPPYYYFKRAKWSIFIPLAIALGRVVQKAHFLSDIFMSILIVMSLTILTDILLGVLARNLKNRY